MQEFNDTEWDAINKASNYCFHKYRLWVDGFELNDIVSMCAEKLLNIRGIVDYNKSPLTYMICRLNGYILDVIRDINKNRAKYPKPKMLSIDYRMEGKNGEFMRIIDTVKSEYDYNENLFMEELSTVIGYRIKKLNIKEKSILKDYFWKGKNLKQIAKRLRVTESRASQILTSIKRKLYSDIHIRKIAYQYLGLNLSDKARYERKCISCNNVLSIDKFLKNRNNKSGYMPKCKDCYYEWRANRGK